MNILINPFLNTIDIYKAGTKKEPEYSFSYAFNCPIYKKEDVLNVIIEFSKEEEFKKLAEESSNVLIIPDFFIAYGLFELPMVSRFKIMDIFNTRFKMCYPNYTHLYYSAFQYEKKTDGLLYFYSISKKDFIDEIINLFTSNGVKVKSINYFGKVYNKFVVKDSTFPTATLIVGEYYSELIITRNERVISNTIFNYGSGLILTGKEYIQSGSNIHNDESLKYSVFIKENFATKNIISDENIMKTAANSDSFFPKPRETRIIKEPALSNYNKKNNIRKFYCSIADLVDFYGASPWFLPLHEIDVICDDEFYDEFINLTKDYRNLEFKRKDVDLSKCVNFPIEKDELFNKTMSGERRKIDWAKFLTFEIGKKKKA